MTSMKTTNRASGFSLLELMVAMGLGVIVLGAATQLFTVGMKTSSLVSNRAEMQQNTRSALSLIAKDVSLAGAGLPPNGIQLPNGAGNLGLSRFACDQGGTCYLNNNNYAVGVVNGVGFTNYMFGLQPGFANGMQKGGPTNIPATSRVPDAVTIVYVDGALALDKFTGAYPDNTGTQITLTAPVPMPATLPPATDPGVGIKVGDLLMVTTSKGTGVGEVSVVNPLSVTGATVTFTDNDALNINQSVAASNTLKTILTGAGTPVTVRRLLAISYFVQIPTNGQLPRLMRQINGATAQPVADNIIDMRITYDLCDTGNVGGVCANTTDPLSLNESPNQIHKVSITLMGQSLASNGRDSQSMQLATAVSTRNLTFKDRYQ